MHCTLTIIKINNLNPLLSDDFSPLPILKLDLGFKIRSCEKAFLVPDFLQSVFDRLIRELRDYLNVG